MYVRFVSWWKNEDSHAWLGILQVVYRLQEREEVLPYQEETLEESLGFIEEELPVPWVFACSDSRRAICWLRPTAEELIERMWTLAILLEDHDVHVRMLKSPDPGRLVYEDEWQVVARPWQRDRRRF